MNPALALVSEIRRLVVEVLRRAVYETEAHRLSVVPLNPQARFGCVVRACSSIDLATRTRWGASGMPRSGYACRAVEAIDLLRMTISAVNGDSMTDAWAIAIRARAQALAFGPREDLSDVDKAAAWFQARAGHEVLARFANSGLDRRDSGTSSVAPSAPAEPPAWQAHGSDAEDD